MGGVASHPVTFDFRCRSERGIVRAAHFFNREHREQSDDMDQRLVKERLCRRIAAILDRLDSEGRPPTVLEADGMT